MLDVAKIQPERDETLLRPVVEVALEPPPFLVGRGDDAGARLLDLGELAADLDPQPGDLDREARPQDHRIEQARGLQQGRVMNESGELKLAAAHRRAPIGRGGQLGNQMPGLVGVNTVVRQPEEEAQARVRDRLRKHLANSLGLGPADAQISQEAIHVLEPLVPRPVEAAIDKRLYPRPQRAEGEGDGEGRGGGRNSRAAADHDTAEKGHRDERGGQQHRKRAVDQRRVDQAIDLVEPVAHHRNPDRERDRYL